MARRYLIDPLPAPGPALLPEHVAHHVGTVLRAKVGTTLTLFDGQGRQCQAEIRTIGRKLVEVHCGPTGTRDHDLPVRIEVAFATPKGNRCDWLFEHGTEVGIHQFRPILTTRSTDREDTSRSAERTTRWRRIVAAAAGQCDRLWLPEVSPPTPLQDLLADPTLPNERYLAGAADVGLTAAQGQSVLLLVGPEGGFTASELDSIQTAGCQPRHLGPLTLRTETAVIAGTVRLLAAAPVHGSTWSRSSAKL